jgi:exodeoxyribonuclease VII large subunit
MAPLPESPLFQAGPGPRDPRDIYSVTRLNTEVRDLLESSFPALWVEGELSNLARPASGHLYFSLKDASSQVRCAMFRANNRLLTFEPENGQHVLARARVSLYPARGDYQLIIEHLEAFGEGALQRAFEALKRRLAAEGLFDVSRKRPLPALPRRIGVITSPSGAAVRDILTVTQRRFPAIPIRIYPVSVQGAGAAEQIAQALRLASERGDCDVLVLARGGGSLEDLWAFNEEAVARAIAACQVPVVTGVGHEVDVTIADFAADHRAATPSAAAEAVTPDQLAWRQHLAKMEARLATLLHARLRLEGQRVAWLGQRLQHPKRRLQELAQRLDGLSLRLAAAARGRLRRADTRLQQSRAKLQKQHPESVLIMLRARTGYLQQRLVTALRHALARRRAELMGLARSLHTVSPLSTLDRGYAIITTHPEGRLVRSVEQTQPGHRVQARLSDGALLCTVDERVAKKSD